MFTGGGKRVQNKVGGGERKEGERDGFLAGGCVGLELMMYCASFSPTACFPARFMWRPCRVKCFLRGNSFQKVLHICFSQLQF